MGAFSCEGIVLRHADYRENDRMLTLLTPQGRVDALSRGCKRPKSPLMAASEVFTWGNYELFSSKERCVVVNCLIQDSFYPLREDFDKLACAAYMANLCEAVIQPGDNAQKPFLLLDSGANVDCQAKWLVHFGLIALSRPSVVFAVSS